THCTCVLLLFFFQAEDGIRDFHVTGVQTCALPISPQTTCTVLVPSLTWHTRSLSASGWGLAEITSPTTTPVNSPATGSKPSTSRSEERRVGKGVGLGGSRLTKQQTQNKEADASTVG